MNENRRMATVRKVTEVLPIEGADRIEECVIDGWSVVTKKGEFSKGDLVVYFEIDTFIPKGIPQLGFLMERGTKQMEHGGETVEGHVLKTVRLRGVYSQGLVISPKELGIADAEALYESGEALDERIGVWEYERPAKLTYGSPKFILNPYDVSVAPVTNAERAQNCTAIWDALKKVESYATIKVDGTSMTMVFDPRKGKLRLFSHHREIDWTVEMDDGRRTVAQESYDAATRQGIVAFCYDNPGITVQYELTGPKIGPAMTKDFQCHVFAVWDMATMHKYTPDEILMGDWKALVESHVKVMNMKASDFETVADLLEAADGLIGNVVKGKRDEGIVFHVTGQGDATDAEWQAVRRKLSSTMEFKAVSNKYLLKRKG